MLNNVDKRVKDFSELTGSISENIYVDEDNKSYSVNVTWESSAFIDDILPKIIKNLIIIELE